MSAGTETEHSVGDQDQTETEHFRSVDEDVECPATEEHTLIPSAKGGVWFPRRIYTLLRAILRFIPFIFISIWGLTQHAVQKLANKYSSDVTAQFRHGYPAGNKSGQHVDDYARTFQIKMMCLESMQLPSVLLDQYRKVNDPDLLVVIDRAVQQIHQHRESARILKHIMESNSGNLMQTSGPLWKQRLEQHESIIQLNMTQLVDALSKTKEDTLVEMVDATAQSAAESKSRQALIDLNQTMLSASQTAGPATIHVQNIEHCPVQQHASRWIPSLSEQDVERHRRQIIKQSQAVVTSLA